MTMPDDNQKKSPADRFHTIISNASADKSPDEQTKKTEVTDRLPKKSKPAVSSVPPPAPHSSDRKAGSISKKESYLRVFWTIASGLSLVVNVILLFVLGVVLLSGNAVDLGKGVLGGLYSNFERMDQAHIKTNIPVQATVPIGMDIPIQTTTGITLAQDVLIHNARVKISTATFNIDSPADVTLPAGTQLNVTLDFSVPVKTEVPVNLNVVVDIPLQNTELHPAIAGLQSTIKPLYCMINPFAKALNGSSICP